MSCIVTQAPEKRVTDMTSKCKNDYDYHVNISGGLSAIYLVIRSCSIYYGKKVSPEWYERIYIVFDYVISFKIVM